MVNFLAALKTIHIAEVVEKLAVLMLPVYLTDVWGLGVTHAAGLINIWVGVTRILPLIFLFLMNNYFGSYSLLVISTTSSALGMGLLTISTPSWLNSLITGSCREYKMKCIGEIKQLLFYVALVLIMIGKSARLATMQTLKFKRNASEQDIKLFVTFMNDSLPLKATVLVLAPWSIIFGIPSVCSTIAMFLLMGKSWSHKLVINKPERSPFTSVLRVFVASISKASLDLPYESATLNHNVKTDDLPVRHSSSLRFLEKAAIPGPKGKGRRNRWLLCSLEEVEDAKTLVRMLPIGDMVAFLMLIGSICSTYFIQQAKRMKPMAIFGVEVMNVSNLIWLHLTTKDGYLIQAKKDLIYNNSYENKKILLRSRVIDAIKHAIWCFVIAAFVEKSRLGVISKHGLANKPGEIIPMTMFWALPQFVLLGIFDASVEHILLIFFAEDMPLPMKNFMIFVFEAFIGIGIMSNVLLVYLVGKISEIGGRANWFQQDTESSRFDLFYWLLTVLCILVSWYYNKVSSQQRVNV